MRIARACGEQGQGAGVPDWLAAPGQGGWALGIAVHVLRLKD